MLNLFSVSKDGGTILIDFPAVVISAFPEQFRSGTFVQEEDFEVPEEIKNQLGIPGPFFIPAGKYPLQDLGDSKRMTVPASQ